MMPMMRFTDRQQAGQRLAAHLARLEIENPVVLALPRGGVPVGRVVADELGAPLDVLVARKIGAPMQPELGVGAIVEGGTIWIDRDLSGLLGITDDELEEIGALEAREIERRVARYRGERPLPELRGRTAILVDDGVATGGTARAALRELRRRGAARIILAVPVGPADTMRKLADEGVADEIVFVECPDDLWAIGAWYEDFHQVSDAEVITSLEAGERPRA
jgi:putative phosphoribosyl transferase